MSDWITEKAEERWDHAGLECATVRNPFGGLNGYVRLPESFRSRKLLAEDINYDEVDVSGGLTYGMDEGGWVGWDTLHSWDNWHDPDEIRESMRDSLCNNSEGRTWTPKGVKRENSKLAEQLAAWAERHPDVESDETPAEHLERIRREMRERAAASNA